MPADCTVIKQKTVSFVLSDTSIKTDYESSFRRLSVSVGSVIRTLLFFLVRRFLKRGLRFVTRDIRVHLSCDF